MRKPCFGDAFRSNQGPTTNDGSHANDRFTLVSRAQQIHIQPNCSRNPGGQLAEESVSRVDVCAFAVLRPQQPALEWRFAWIVR